MALYGCIVFLVYFLDQSSKFCVRRFISQGTSIPVIKDVFHLTLIHNTGAAFGIFREHTYVFVIIAALAVVLITAFLIKKARVLNAFERTALCFVLGGTLGNLTDRVLYGYVTDFMDIRVWPVFNIADSFITVGAFMLAVSVVMSLRKEKRSKEVRK